VNTIIATDLRPGNYVKCFIEKRNFRQKKLVCLTLIDLISIDAGKLKVYPVELVREWLPRFGFSYSVAFNHFALTPCYVLQKDNGWFFYKNSIAINEHPVLYVHQFQNLFYFLAGGTGCEINW
jgi:hypothetical protein